MRRYQPFFSEENIWWLCRELSLARRGGAVIIMAGSGAHELEAEGPSLLMWGQRAAEPGEALIWDYHVVAWDRREDLIWDLDSRLPCPGPARGYLAASFPHSAAGVRTWAPRFRLMAAGDYVAGLKTDRRHMRDEDGRWYHPPPSWAPPGAPGFNLGAWIDLDREAGIPGERLDFATLWGRTRSQSEDHGDG